MSATPLRLLILGAHPDDAEYHAGGLATIYRQAGHTVKMISATDGQSGHFRMSGRELSDLRREEAYRSAAIIGATYDVWNFPDGRLLPTLELREQIIRELRTFAPDLVLTHRLNDYHPDHRAVGQAVQDASYMVTVPPICPDTPILRRDPVVGYLPDLFTRPVPLRPDVLVDITSHLTTVTRLLAQHASQFFEWIPYNERQLESVPDHDANRLHWLENWFAQKIAPRADRFRAELIRQYGTAHGGDIRYCEAFEISEYAAPLDDTARQRLFWFLS
ncbi:MAG: PIG-L family deacetylase [Planctomycetes bacterium]|nr:PIG-L family deacetylase [Planctomycetota bacterium]